MSAMQYFKIHNTTRLWLSFLVVSALLITLVSCESDEKWPAAIDWINPPQVPDTRELAGTWSPGDLLSITFQARSGSDGIVQPSALGLGLFPEKSCCRVPEGLVLRERVAPTSGQYTYILEWELPADLTRQGDGIL